ncbi:hypothetical protein [Cereibacter azotoformans]|uniref:UrcA family protein n=2 Tax=Cereibacter TaxID=1653176 RepID=A0A2T5KBA3_9RHOB|nr:hypothetical protein [Cereibacter azotoformans]AXQ93841.1 hypothetical protein D0Z66_08580 [Cereibacter sphaeroides]MBO4168354.1 hypothetical protein [Cereibacter azotoformans]PTR19669.1 hypothetical protein C8J28_104153 [Cereibacter azotoformans]
MTLRFLLTLALLPLPALAQTAGEAPPPAVAGGSAGISEPDAGAGGRLSGPDAGAVRAAPDLHFDESLNDYPTLARADYIFACLAANGQDRNTMRRCACSIDVIASILPYEAYEKAETILAMRLGAGERANLFRIPSTQAGVADLRRAQAEAEMTCF